MRMLIRLRPLGTPDSKSRKKTMKAIPVGMIMPIRPVASGTPVSKNLELTRNFDIKFVPCALCST